MKPVKKPLEQLTLWGNDHWEHFIETTKNQSIMADNKSKTSDAHKAPEGFDVLRDAYLVITFKDQAPNGFDIRRTCLGTEANLVTAVIAAMGRQPEIKGVLFKAVQLVTENPDILLKIAG